MTPGQKVAQLLLTATSSQGATSALLNLVHRGEIGSVILNGHSFLGLSATRRIVNQLQAAVPNGAPDLFVSTDQEGGVVQDLNGPGFDTIPGALQQGQLSVSVLRQRAGRWGRQLRAAGISLTLGPVLDTVPGRAAAQRNPPIGQLDREFGYTPGVVASHGVAVVKAMAAAGVDATAKHFPGLGRVTGNTDLAAGVTDTQTTATDPYLRPFAAAIKAGIPFVMMSTAVYTRIDPANPAAFSHRIVTTLLRDRLGFDGVVISDDVGGAAQVATIPVGERAVRFVAAGGDIVLTVDPAQIPVMRAALLSAMSQPAFARLVDAAALRVLVAKSRAGLH
jgi:beta-N-acetylhexosaminidase